MDLFGIGMLEVVVILLVAIVVLGPAGAINAARNAGKMLGEVRRAMSDLSRAVEVEELEGEPGKRTDDTPRPGKGAPPRQKP